MIEDVIERRLRRFERARAGFDQMCEIRREDDIRHFQRAGLLCSLPQILGICVRQVDDASFVQCAGSSERAEYDNFHEKRLPFKVGPRAR
jgi:hypothetical protein